MAILADQHMHSSFSFDSDAPMRSMVESAIEKGLTVINITEHNDSMYPVSKEFPAGSWDLNVDSYLYDLLMLREEFEKKIHIGFGIELGLQECAFKENAIISGSQRFDFIIGSIHLVNGVDTYDPKYYEGRGTKEAFNEYFDALLRNIKKFRNFDVLGHLDYLTRKIPEGEDSYNPLDYWDKITEIFSVLIENGKGLELNTQALMRGLKNPNPGLTVLKKYKEMGGEFITIGSDAHKPEGIAGGFDVAEQLLKDAGFKYYTVFRNREPIPYKL